MARRWTLHRTAERMHHNLYAHGDVHHSKRPDSSSMPHCRTQTQIHMACTLCVCRENYETKNANVQRFDIVMIQGRRKTLSEWTT